MTFVGVCLCVVLEMSDTMSMCLSNNIDGCMFCCQTCNKACYSVFTMPDYISTSVEYLGTVLIMK